eukprot:CAMPEP_0113297294 /NCGR_PEP_ID=MMETSP0010_2-20120614/218_1 /TAXON_ID=216773 ORGANISM="Corethron hystrix, Strain 308" /NCGR_SAMPLE_ID=MMETSP0010_2 /ASSEMBLY_ACC=CAM_ASM_000155 /LENGTH=121 /DNA_ID=CAMNT_0000150163 /DNA_START=998 /DNA_END=1360 /DNA_ORIENTATION=- /assembly_acc=CAM_ASM_000155
MNVLLHSGLLERFDVSGTSDISKRPDADGIFPSAGSETGPYAQGGDNIGNGSPHPRPAIDTFDARARKRKRSSVDLADICSEEGQIEFEVRGIFRLVEWQMRRAVAIRRSEGSGGAVRGTT